MSDPDDTAKVEQIRQDRNRNCDSTSPVRPHVNVNFDFVSSRCPLVRLASESLSTYGTIIFGIEVMHEYIQISDVEPGQIDASKWWSLVPEVYREDVWTVAERVSLEFIRRGELLNEETILVYREALNDAIWREVKPR